MPAILKFTTSIVLTFIILIGTPVNVVASDFKMEEWFQGHSVAYGKFSAINGQTRSFRVDLNGRWNGKRLKLREDFVYDDGERATKTWIFTKTGPASFSGTREDVVGATTVTVRGNIAKFNYLVDLTPKDEPTLVRFFDTIKLETDGTLRNTAIVTKFKFPVARVVVNFARTEKQAKAIKPR